SGPQKGKLALTPLFIALVAIGLIDVMFAFDSIPAIYGITPEAFLVFTTNAFSLMGLRQMYFLLDGLLDRRRYFSYGLDSILGFISVKLVVQPLHENNLPFVNGGEYVSVRAVATGTCLIEILGVLIGTEVASVFKNKRDEAQGCIRISHHDY